MLADRYRLGALLGVGGMGQVREAWDLVLDAPVAVKQLTRGGDDPSAVERFRREAIASSRLGHPNIVVTHDVIADAGSMALVMEKVDGPSLRTVLHDRGKLDPECVLDLGVQLAEGLAAVHAVGIVHRDLKPANLLLQPTASGPRLKVADFGIASLPDTEQMTRAGTVLGTPAYMAPERFRGMKATPQQDVYALGIILHELLTGRAPVDADSPIEVLATLMQLESHTLALPETEPLFDFITDAVQFDPALRPADGAVALATLKALRPPPVLEDEDDGAVVVLGGLTLSALLPLIEGVAEVGQAIGDDIVVRFDAPESAFRWARDVVYDESRIRAAFDAGTIVGSGLGLFAGEAVGRAARLVRIATPGELLVGPGGRRAIGLGLRAGLEALGAVHLAGITKDTDLYRVRAGESEPSQPVSVRVEDGVGWVECRCRHTIEAALPHLAHGARVACSRCGRVMRVAPVAAPELNGDAATRDLVVHQAPAEDDTILNLLVDA
ncbi:MAG: serine/threonine-protein kinase [Sandaracinaceae bacterium]